MEPWKLFINSAGRLRSGWRLAGFLLAYVVFLFLITSAARVAYAAATYFAPGVRLGLYVQDVVYRLIILTSTLAAGYVCCRWLEGLPWRSLGLSLHARWFRDLSVGTAIGIASLALAAGLAAAGGGLRFTFSTAGIFPHVAKTLVLSGVLFIIAALAEEALFRGYPLQTLTRARFAVLGVLLTSVPFAAVHLQNPNVAAGFTFVNTALAGVWLAMAYLRTRSLWFPLGVHWSWNWALGSLFGLPVSGITRIAPHPLLQGTDLGPAWLTGGSYGIEGGLACTVTLVISTIFIWRTGWVSATEEMKRLTSQENPTETSLVISPVPQRNEIAAE
ncbi:MAG: CPBP family intramembrane metalloprotease [Pyrinomonadaceae bacterium]|nr:CPBP family intramembrane metalloprotease [Pyrinomonadaceae bacterium]